MSEQVFGFNTGRLYQSDGQRISVSINRNGEVLFCDHSRGIDGKLNITENWELWTEVFTLNDKATIVMSEYDKCNYSYDSRANHIKATEFPKW